MSAGSFAVRIFSFLFFFPNFVPKPIGQNPPDAMIYNVTLILVRRSINGHFVVLDVFIW